MSKFTLDFEIITPMFMAGANQKSTEFRLQSFKGVLRFWWRAVTFAKYQSINKLRIEEDGIFGSTEKASRITLNLESYRKGRTPVQFKNKYGLIYLGYCAVGFRGNTTRRYIPPSTTGRISIFCKGLSNDQLELLKQALTAFALFGNMGSKSRKGYGSFSVRKLTLDNEIVYEQPRNAGKLEKLIKNFFAANRFSNLRGMPPFSAFSSQTRIDIIDTGTDALELLNIIGERMVLYRSWGRNGRVMNRPAERNFKKDHDLIKDMQYGKKPTDHPDRVNFGLPHNYFFSSSKFKASVEPDSKEINRRASPLFIKIHKVGDRSYAAVSLILRSQFLPQNIKIKISSRKISNSVQARPDWSVLDKFLDGVDKLNKPRFPKKRAVVP